MGKLKIWIFGSDGAGHFSCLAVTGGLGDRLFEEGYILEVTFRKKVINSAMKCVCMSYMRSDWNHPLDGWEFPFLDRAPADVM
jgi:hypothetical protein